MGSNTTKKKKKRISKAQRQRQQKLMVIGAIAVVVIVIIICVFALGSCGTDYADAETNTVYVLKNGKIVSTDIEDFDEDTYSEDELEDYMEDVIDTYNNENGKKAVKQKSFKVKKDIATLVMEYASADVYKDFNGTEIFVGTIAEAVEAGYDFDVVFANVSGSSVKEASADDFMNDDSYKVVIIKANTTVSVDGNICYVSTENTSEVDKTSVVIKEGCELAIEADEAVGTETEFSDDSISEEELLLGTDGESDMVFDFGEDLSEGSQYSDVYTYIIYKQF